MMERYRFDKQLLESSTFHGFPQITAASHPLLLFQPVMFWFHPIRVFFPLFFFLRLILASPKDAGRNRFASRDSACS